MSQYVGRFAPAPSGPLHFGSIIAALGSYLQAKSHGGEWLLRLEDSDHYRVVDGSADLILKTLEKLNLYWDRDVIIQSQRENRYQEVLDMLLSMKLAYFCSCTRKETRGKPYPGTCRTGTVADHTSTSVRILTTNSPVEFTDLISGRHSQHIEIDVGDFVIKRTDGVAAYHLAVVVDDADQGITEIVRGADLIDSTPRQIYLQQVLNYPTPGYLHLPIARDRQGRKISKQNNAPGIDVNDGARVLSNALEFLGQAPDPELARSKPSDVINWGIENWDIKKIPKITNSSTVN